MILNNILFLNYLLKTFKQEATIGHYLLSSTWIKSTDSIDIKNVLCRTAEVYTLKVKMDKWYMPNNGISFQPKKQLTKEEAVCGVGENICISASDKSLILRLYE